MKKIIATLFLGLVLVGCGGGNSSDSGAPLPPVEAPIVNNDPIVFDETAERARIKEWSDANPGFLVLPEGESFETLEFNKLSSLFAEAFVKQQGLDIVPNI